MQAIRISHASTVATNTIVEGGEPPERLLPTAEARHQGEKALGEFEIRA